MRFLRSLALCGVGLASACAAESQPDPASTRAAVSQTAPRTNLVSLDADDAAALRADLAPGALDLRPIVRDGRVEVVELSDLEVAQLSDLMHERINRCGGFLVHDSLADAADAARVFNGEFERSAHLAAADYTIDRPTVVEAVLPELDEGNIVGTISVLEAYGNRYHNIKGPEAADWLLAEWQALAAGRDDVTARLIDNRRTPMPNVELTIEGAVDPGTRVIIGGHLDTKNTVTTNEDSPGADDDASGIAVISEVARALLAKDYRPDYSVTFYGYAAEEVGLFGSSELAQAASERGDQILGVMQLDMVNFPESTERGLDGSILSDFADPDLADFVRDIIATYTPYQFSTSSCGYGCSDHASWARNGFPAVMPFESDFRDFQRSRIHTGNDKLELSDGRATHALKFAEIGAAYVVELAKGSLGGDDPPDDDPPDDDPPDDDPPDDDPPDDDPPDDPPGDDPPGDDPPDDDPPGDDPPGDDPPGDDPPGDDPPDDDPPGDDPPDDDPATPGDQGPGRGDAASSGGCHVAPTSQGVGPFGLLGVFALLGLVRRRRRAV